MKHIHKLGLGALFFCALVMSACASRAPDITYPPDIHNSRISVDWAGTYVGNTPSAGGMGIIVRLTLNRDETYVLYQHYVGRADPDYTTTGRFYWDDKGSIITLESNAGGPPYYQVGENRLWQLDLAGKRITGDLADLYILNKE